MYQKTINEHEYILTMLPLANTIRGEMWYIYSDFSKNVK